MLSRVHYVRAYFLSPCQNLKMRSPTKCKGWMS